MAVTRKSTLVIRVGVEALKGVWFGTGDDEASMKRKMKKEIREMRLSGREVIQKEMAEEMLKEQLLDEMNARQKSGQYGMNGEKKRRYEAKIRKEEEIQTQER